MIPVPGLCDTIALERTGGCGPELINRGMAVDCPPEKNLCLRAYDLLAERYDIGGVRITLDKCVPFGAGLGGGSSDAAFTLRGLCELFGLPCREEELIELAARLGSDVPFFIRNRPQLCTGRGEVMTPAELTQLAGLWLVLVKPATFVSTAEAYAGVTPREPDVPLTERLAAPVMTWTEGVVNDFERSVFAAHPELSEIKRRLLDMGALYAAMSGSGSAIFGLFDCDPPCGEDFSDCFIHKERL